MGRGTYCARRFLSLRLRLPVWIAVDLAGHHNVLVIHAVAAKRESVQIEEGTQAALDTPEGMATPALHPAQESQSWSR